MSIPSTILKTERLTLRPFVLADALTVQKLAGDRDVAATTLLIPHPYPDGAAESWIATHPAERESGKGIPFAMEQMDDKQLIGAIHLAIDSGNNQAEVGYWIGKPFWNKGFCTEALRAVLKYGFEGLGLARIFARHMSDNPASGRVMIKSGMKHEGTLRSHGVKWGVRKDYDLYGILADEMI